MSQKWFIAFRRVMAYFNFSFLAYRECTSEKIYARMKRISVEFWRKL